VIQLPLARAGGQTRPSGDGRLEADHQEALVAPTAEQEAQSPQPIGQLASGATLAVIDFPCGALAQRPALGGAALLDPAVDDPRPPAAVLPAD